MGALRDAAKKNSNFLKLEKGEEIICTYLEYRIIPSTMDPTKETVQYKFHTPHGDKYWTNGNSAIMMLFDDLAPGATVRIKRDVWLNKQGIEDPTKSAWKVEEVKQEL